MGGGINKRKGEGLTDEPIRRMTESENMPKPDI
jgi:hypothetical protein